MGYTGRIVLLIFTVVSFVVWHFTHGLRFDIFNVFLVIFFGILSLWLGLQYDRAKYFSEKDTLTGVYNRRFVEFIFPKILAQVERKNEHISLSVIDCNDFKPINDIYGHKVGDEVLITLSSLLVGEIRKSDIVARWGGDEFLIIYPNANEEGVQVIINRIQNKLAKFSESIQIDISISIGTATYPTDGSTLDELIKKADKRMYKVKAVNKKRT